MRTIERAHRILEESPREALADAIGLGVMAALIFAGFLVPALL